MDGIVGIVYPDTFQVTNLAEVMLKTIKHRTTKENDIQTYKNIQLGVCGSKIASNNKKTIYLGLDGTIFNSNDILQEINREGAKVKSKHIQDILIAAYQLWGEKFLQKLTGDFAIFLLDKNKKRIIIARDRIGKKPLYWFKDRNFLIFGSELKALMSTGLIPQTPAMDAISSYLFFGYIPQDMSPIENVNKLLPAHYLRYNLNESISILPYWSYSSYFEKTTKSSKKNIIRDLDHLLKESVEICLNNENPVGCTLSGGLGSASISTYLKQIIPPKNILAYTVGFLGESNPDIKAAEVVAKHLNIKHKTIYVTKDNFLEDLPKISWHLDEPIADPNVIATWKLAEIASKETETIFTGMGSDELFAGHSRYTTAEQKPNYLGSLFQPTLNYFQRAFIPILNYIFKPGALQLLKQSRTNPWQFDYLERYAIFNEKELKEASPKLAGIFDPEVFLHKFHHLNKIRSRVASYLYFDVKTRLADCYMTQYERLTAANTLKWKAPYLNRQVVEFLAGIPEPEFLEESEAASYLKAVMKNALPKPIIDRPKRTPRNLLKDWIEGPDVVKLFKMLDRGYLVETGLISKIWLTGAIESLGKSESAFRLLWAVLTLEIWFQIYIINPIGLTPPDVSVEELLS